MHGGMNQIIWYVEENKQWLFSGVGVTAVVAAGKAIASVIKKRRHSRAGEANHSTLPDAKHPRVIGTGSALVGQVTRHLEKQSIGEDEVIRSLQVTEIRTRDEDRARRLERARMRIQAGQQTNARVCDLQILRLLGDAAQPMRIERIADIMKLKRFKVMAGLGSLEAKGEVRKHFCCGGLAYAITTKGAQRCVTEVMS